MNSILIENQIIELLIALRSKVRSFLLFGRYNKVKFGKNVRLSSKILFEDRIKLKDNCTLKGEIINIHHNVTIHENVLIRSDQEIEILENTTINRNCCILGKVRIGRHCSIGPNVVLIGGNHIFNDRTKHIKQQGVVLRGITIEDDVWIGANSTVLDGVRLGEGSIVAAGAVVTRDIAPYKIVGGVPARELKSRP